MVVRTPHGMKGMNTANKVTKTLGAKSRGTVTDGADLSKGYKTVGKGEHTQKGAHSINNKSDNMKHHR